MARRGMKKGARVASSTTRWMTRFALTFAWSAYPVLLDALTFHQHLTE